MLAYTLRSFGMDDPAYEQVYDLREEVLRKPLGQSLRNDDMSNEPNESIIAAITNIGEIVGCVMLRPLSKGEIKLRQMAVSPSLQGKGIGMALLQKAEEVARTAGYGIISLHARQPAVPFYEQAGYTIHGDVFTEVGIPHLFMNKTIHATLP